ncbi:hypothetical protein Tco_1140203 [Tanacetum coccineum]
MLEGVAFGVPMVTWLNFADQFLNKTFIVEILKIGGRIGVEIPVLYGEEDKLEALVKKEDVKRAVECLMDKEDEEEKTKKKAHNAPNMFSIQIHHGGNFQRYLGRMYVSGRVDIFDMVDINLFTVVALNMMVLKLGYTGESEPMFYNYLRPLTSLDKGLYALACEEDGTTV